MGADSDAPSKRPPTPAKDLEYGMPQRPPTQQGRNSVSQPSSKRSSLPADDEAASLPWNPSHPCYPHRNPHVPVVSTLYGSTRIIRIPRDWMMAGDLAPTFSNTYPEILEPWVGEADFRILIKGVNDRLISTFSPFEWRNWLDVALGVLTGWIWEDLGFAGVKKGCKDVENFIEEWNGLRRVEYMEKEDESDLAKVIPLRRTGYLSLDIQIPDPKVGLVESKPASEANAEEHKDVLKDGPVE